MGLLPGDAPAKRVGAVGEDVGLLKQFILLAAAADMQSKHKN